ncbi:MAG: hypothetical protein M3275_07535 [Thermoproteota archaeon]|nr:hypothetical protein [Thermoproteota archaeon]
MTGTVTADVGATAKAIAELLLTRVICKPTSYIRGVYARKYLVKNVERKAETPVSSSP